MTRFATLGLCALMGLAFGSRFVAAHHSTTMFDHAKTMTIRGVVLELRWVNPHVSLLVKGVVDGEQTEQEDWLMEMTSPGNLVRAGGWSRNAVKAGDRVVVEFSPLRHFEPRRRPQEGHACGDRAELHREPARPGDAGAAIALRTADGSGICTGEACRAPTHLLPQRRHLASGIALGFIRTE